MTANASAEGCDDVTDVAAENMASYLSDYENKQSMKITVKTPFSPAGWVAPVFIM